MRVLGFMLSATAVVTQEVDDTAYLLQTRTQQQKLADIEDCYVTGGCSTVAVTEAPTTTTTEAPTTTTARPTRPATTTPRPTRPTTTTTTTPVAPPIGQKFETPPKGKPPSYDDYCTPKSELTLKNPTSNNLGGMGPNFDDVEEMRYKNVTKRDVNGVETNVHLVITTVGNAYYQRNIRKQAYGQTGKSFVGKYNGGGAIGRSDVMAIGSLATGDFTFKFSFEDDDATPVVIDYLPLTFFDLDGDKKVRGKSYEELSTEDSAGTLYVEGTEVGHSCEGSTCSAQGAKVEVKIPADFTHLDPLTKRAAITFLFKGKSSFNIKYTLNWEHRVFLFKGLCINSD